MFSVLKAKRLSTSQLYGASPVICHHTVLSATRHRWTRLALTTAMADRYLIFLTRRDGQAELTWMVRRLVSICCGFVLQRDIDMYI